MFVVLFLWTAESLGTWVHFVGCLLGYRFSLSFNSALQFNGEFKLGPLWPLNLGFSLLPLVGLAFFP